MERRNWTRNELIVAFNLYCRIPFGRIHIRNREIVSLAAALGRTPSALSWKLANFARLDPALQQRNITGAGHGGKLEAEVWDEFSHDWEKLAFESEALRSALVQADPPAEVLEPFPEGTTRETLVRARVNQSFFRSAILAAYGSKCCITGIAIPELLCASHIVPWSVDLKNRTNPRNGLCLNSFHDRAFDRGLLTITSSYHVKVSPMLGRSESQGMERFMGAYAGVAIVLPDRFAPDLGFLEYHARHVYSAG